MTSRTTYSRRNIFTGFAGKIIIFIFAFSTRTVFARLLGTEYAGVDGLYSNILSLLSLADLGIGNVFSYFLYQSLADKDDTKTAALVYSFRKLYIGIGIAVLLIGTAVIPFLPLIVDSALPMREVILYYVFYLLNAAVTYFFTYRTSILVADQKQYISNLSTLLFQLIMYILQLGYLVLTKHFIGYLIIMVLCTVGNNVVLTVIAKKQYPYLRNDKGLVSYAPDRVEIWKNIKATFIYRISAVLLTCTDNILISSLIGTVYVGKYAYYNMLLQYVISYARLFGNSILAGIGNLQTEHDEEKSFRLFEALSMFFLLISVIAGNAFFNCIQQFIPFWVGDEFLLGRISVIAMILTLYVQLTYYPVMLYRESLGLFKEVQYAQLPTAAINIVLSIVLGKLFGIAGVLFATSIAIVSTIYWYEPIVLYRRLGKPVRQYFVQHIHFAITAIVCFVAAGLVCGFLSGSVLGIVLRFVISVGITLLIMWIRFRKTSAWNEMWMRAKSVFRRR